MTKLSNYLRKLLVWVRENDHAFLSIFFVIILSVLLVNSLHEEYPDEFDNILGGKYLLNGILIYKGFFTHHGPTAYFLSALIELISGNSFVFFRIVFAFFIFGFFLWSYLFLRKKFGRSTTTFYLGFIGLMTLAGNYYWLHMLLADTLSAYFLAPVVALLFLSTIYKKALVRRDLVVISILIAATVLCSLTFLYLSLILYSYTLYLYIKGNKLRLVSRDSLMALVILGAPYLVFLIYLLVTFSIGEYFYQGWLFNQRYYIYNYPRPEGSTAINPIRFAVVIAHTFYNSYFTLLEQIPTFNLGFPLNITLAAGTLGTVIYLISRRFYFFASIFITLLIYANARSEPLNSKETDYQSAVYIMIAFLVIPFLLTKIAGELRSQENITKRIIDIVLFLLVGFYALFSTLFLFQKFFNRSFDKYMGTAPLIYDRPELAPLLNRVIGEDDPIWIGPFEFKELFYSNGRPASHYHIFIPGMGFAPEVRKKMIEEFEETKPTLVYFQKNFFILGRNPEMYGQFFITYLSDHYILLSDYTKNGVHYKSSVPKTDRVDLEGRLYVRKEKADEVIKKMLDNNLIHESTE